jgi:drug/metabolite transporter (DMT)-like permease
MSALAPRRAQTAAAYAGFALISGCAFFFTKVASRSFPACTLAALRMLIGAVPLALAHRVLAGGEAALWRAHWRALAVMGLLNCALPYSLYPYAIHRASSGVVAVVAGASPLLAMLLAAAALRGRPDEAALVRITPRKLLGVCMGVGGVICILVDRAAADHAKSASSVWRAAAGVAIALLAVSSKAAAAVFAHAALPLPVLSAAYGQTVAGAAWALVGAAVVDFGARPSRPFDFAHVEPAAAGGLLYLGLLSSCVVYLFQFFLLRHHGAARQTLVDLAAPVVGLLAGVAFAGEWRGAAPRVIALQLAGCALVCLGVAFSGASLTPARRVAGGGGDGSEEEEGGGRGRGRGGGDAPEGEPLMHAARGGE